MIYCFALILGIKLAGVARYDQEKLRRHVFNEPGRQPEPADILHAGKRLRQISIIAGFLVIFCATMIWLLIKS